MLEASNVVGKKLPQSALTGHSGMKPMIISSGATKLPSPDTMRGNSGGVLASAGPTGQDMAL